MDARGKFGEHERSIRTARGVARTSVSIHHGVYVVHGTVGEDSIPRKKPVSSSLFSSISGETL